MALFSICLLVMHKLIFNPGVSPEPILMGPATFQMSPTEMFHRVPTLSISQVELIASMCNHAKPAPSPAFPITAMDPVDQAKLIATLDVSSSPGNHQAL